MNPAVSVRGAGNVLRVAARFQEAVMQSLHAAAEAAAVSAKGTSLFNDRSGETRGSIHTEAKTFSVFLIAGGAARFLEGGTRPHWIGSAVMVAPGTWRWIGMHPGTAARPFMREARDVGEKALLAATSERVGAALAAS